MLLLEIFVRLGHLIELALKLEEFIDHISDFLLALLNFSFLLGCQFSNFIFTCFYILLEFGLGLILFKLQALLDPF